MTLSAKLGVVGISTLWHFRLPLPIQIFIKVASSPRLSGIGMPSPILWSHPLKMQRIVLLSSLLWWELGTNSLITGPGEWLSFRRFTSKLSWSWCYGMALFFFFFFFIMWIEYLKWYVGIFWLCGWSGVFHVRVKGNKCTPLGSAISRNCIYSVTLRVAEGVVKRNNSTYMWTGPHCLQLVYWNENGETGPVCHSGYKYSSLYDLHVTQGISTRSLQALYVTQGTSTNPYIPCMSLRVPWLTTKGLVWHSA